MVLRKTSLDTPANPPIRMPHPVAHLLDVPHQNVYSVSDIPQVYANSTLFLLIAVLCISKILFLDRDIYIYERAFET